MCSNCSYPMSDIAAANERVCGTESFIQHYPVATAGAPIQEATNKERTRRHHQDVGPFADPQVFEIAELLFTSGMSGKKTTKLLQLKRFQGVGPWDHNCALLRDIDAYLPRGPKWLIKTFKVVGSNGVQYAQFWFQNSLDGISSLCFESMFKDFIIWRPSKVYSDPECTKQKHGETTTAGRMWDLQDMIPDKHATVVPTFFASNKTALTVIVGDQKAHPVYMTIGNLPKHLRRQVSKRAMILVGYIPVISLECKPNAEKRSLLKQKLFHECMRTLVAPLKQAGKTGAEVVCSDGFVRCIYPVFCGGTIDFPEQCKYACTKFSFCPTCEVPAKERGDLTDYPLRDRQKTLDAISEHQEEGSALFEILGLVDIKPFWDNLPWVDPGTLFPPDLLHQVYKGVFKDHLSKWSAHIVGTKAFDDRYKAMSQHHGLRHFKKGVTKVSRWTGREVKEQCKAYLPTVADQEPEVTQCARALLRFMYLAHSLELTDEDLDEMEQCIQAFHEDKDIFRELGALGEQDPTKKKGLVRTFHMIAKLHALQHYVNYIRKLGTPNGYNTELPEQLHIPYAKVGFRRSNKKDVIKQMATYFQRMEAIAMHRAYLDELGNTDDNDKGKEDDYEEFGKDEVMMEGFDQLALDDLEAEQAEDNDEDGTEEEDAPETGEDQELETAVIEGELEVDNSDEVGTEPEQRNVENGTWIESYNIDAKLGWQVGASAFYPDPYVKHAKKPTLTAPGTHIILKHGATQLTAAIESFLKQHGRYTRGLDISPLHNYCIWNRCRLIHSPPPFKPSKGEKIDVIRAFPAIVDEYGRPRKEAQFDTALFIHDKEQHGLHRYQACRIRAIFELPDNIRHLYSKKLVYVKLFNPFHTNFNVRTQLYKTTHTLTSDGRRHAIVMPLSDIHMTCHIAPHYGTATAKLDLQSKKDILESCQKFLFNDPLPLVALNVWLNLVFTVSIKKTRRLLNHNSAPTNTMHLTVAQMEAMSRESVDWLLMWECPLPCSPEWAPPEYTSLKEQEFGHEDVAQMCAKFITGLFTPDDPPTTSQSKTTLKLSQFITYTQFQTRLNLLVTFCAVHYLSRLKDQFPPSRDSHGRLLFLAAFLIATKMMKDHAYKNLEWHKVGQQRFTIPEINKMERKMCCALEWCLYVKPQVLYDLETLVRRDYGSVSTAPTPISILVPVCSTTKPREQSVDFSSNLYPSPALTPKPLYSNFALPALPTCQTPPLKDLVKVSVKNGLLDQTLPVACSAPST
ncbi:Zn-finger protein, partial [Rhizoctonia solani]